jgi:ubiquinone/menaquinone biosynthesis C-methylase UbiE
MPDVYANIQDADVAVQERLADVQELRAADPKQQAMLASYLDELDLPPDARVLEIGCGSGAIARVIAGREEVRELVAVDPSEVFLTRARELAEGIPGLTFELGDGRGLAYDVGSFDAVVCHTVLSHVPGPEAVLAEAARVTVPGGRLAVFDGDYATTSVAVAEDDPLQACVRATIGAFMHDPFLVRRLAGLVRSSGWTISSFRTHGYLETNDPGYMLTIVDRGADVLVASGVLAEAAGRTLKDEVRRRVERGDFFGFISYASLLADRPTV